MDIPAVMFLDSKEFVYTALAQPKIVTQNLATEIALGRVAGSFSEPPFPNLQGSPIGLVPKEHSIKFCTIFHLSYLKSGDY